MAKSGFCLPGLRNFKRILYFQNMSLSLPTEGVNAGEFLTWVEFGGHMEHHSNLRQGNWGPGCSTDSLKVIYDMYPDLCVGLRSGSSYVYAFLEMHRTAHIPNTGIHPNTGLLSRNSQGQSFTFAPMFHIASRSSVMSMGYSWFSQVSWEADPSLVSPLHPQEVWSISFRHLFSWLTPSWLSF